MFFMSFCLKPKNMSFSVSLYINMCRPFFLSNKRKTYVFSSKKHGKCLEVIEKPRTFAVAFQNYGKRLTLRATRKEFFEKITYNRE